MKDPTYITPIWTHVNVNFTKSQVYEFTERSGMCINDHNPVEKADELAYEQVFGRKFEERN